MEILLFLILLALLFPATMTVLVRVILILLLAVLMFACVGGAFSHPLPPGPPAITSRGNTEGGGTTHTVSGQPTGTQLGRK